jgi:hypothetical protein
MSKSDEYFAALVEHPYGLAAADMAALGVVCEANQSGMTRFKYCDTVVNLAMDMAMARAKARGRKA